jgi:hypothetical protein
MTNPLKLDWIDTVLLIAFGCGVFLIVLAHT